MPVPANSQPRLRLVRPDAAAQPNPLRIDDTPAPTAVPGTIVAPPLPGPLGAPGAAASPLRAAMVARENRAAALLTPTDARWLLAVQAAAQIQGGRAALLTPDRRHRLLRMASRLGLRQFDANLVLAVVQDAARCGEPPLGTESTSRLALVRPPAATRPDRDHWPALLTGLVLGAILLLVLIDWIAPG